MSEPVCIPSSSWLWLKLEYAAMRFVGNSDKCDAITALQSDLIRAYKDCDTLIRLNPKFRQRYYVQRERAEQLIYEQLKSDVLDMP